MNVNQLVDSRLYKQTPKQRTKQRDLLILLLSKKKQGFQEFKERSVEMATVARQGIRAKSIG